MQQRIPTLLHTITLSLITIQLTIYAIENTNIIAYYNSLHNYNSVDNICSREYNIIAYITLSIITIQLTYMQQRIPTLLHTITLSIITIQLNMQQRIPTLLHTITLQFSYMHNSLHNYNSVDNICNREYQHYCIL